METPDYRQRVLDELSAAQAQPSFREVLATGQAPAAPHQVGAAQDEADLTAALDVFQDPNRDDALRLAALHVISLEVFERPDLLDRVLDVYRDPHAPRELRLEALSVLEQSGFLAVGGAAMRPEYLNALRGVVDDDDPDPEVRRRTLGVLAKQKDEYAERRLMEGLQDPSRALLDPAKAIQYLGYDVHAEYFPLLRQIVANPPDPASRKEAVRLLSADPASHDLLLQMLNDKSELRDIRNLSALGLQSIAPDEFEQRARAIVLDDDDYDDIRSTAATALAHFGSSRALRGDQLLAQHVQQLRDTAESTELRQASSDLFDKLAAQDQEEVTSS
jgi:hypothetical protein